MAYTLLIHIMGEDPILGEVEELPSPQDAFLLFSNPRRRDGKPVPHYEPEALNILIPWHRINFVEVLPTREEEREILTFFRP